MSQQNVTPASAMRSNLSNHDSSFASRIRGGLNTDRALRTLTAALCLTVGGFSMASAQTGTELYNFTGGSDGAYPYGGLAIGTGGVVYGLTAQGGTGCAAPGCGTFYRLTPPAAGQTAWSEDILYQFKGGSDGAYPFATLVANEKGVYFGTTASGGNGNGTVFELTPPATGQTAWTETPLYDFIGIANGATPYATVLVGKKHVLYGTTVNGGSGGCTETGGTVIGCGTVFSLTPPAKGQTSWAEAVLYSFQNLPDGANPYASLIQVKADLFGTAAGGGLGHGIVFKLSPPAAGKTQWTETIIYSFNGGTDGVIPYGNLVANGAGVLYGTTEKGGTYNYGTVFSLTPPAKGSKAPWTEQILYNFAGGNISEGGLGTEFDGIYPYSGLVLDSSGALYGTTQRGGYIAYGCSSGAASTLDREHSLYAIILL